MQDCVLCVGGGGSCNVCSLLVSIASSLIIVLRLNEGMFMRTVMCIHLKKIESSEVLPNFLLI